VALVAVVALVTTAVVAVNRIIDQRVAEIPRVSLGAGVLQEVAPGHLPQNILIMGTDAQPGTAVDGARSDTMILLRIRRHSAEAVWFPRDVVVDIPGRGRDRLNQAFLLGGPQLAIDTLKANFDVDVNHYVELDMDALRDLVDAVGGIRVAFPEALRDDISGLDVQAGCVRLDGEAALALARGRAVQAFRDGAWQLIDTRADLDRVERQEQLVGALADEVRADVDQRPSRLARFVDAFLHDVKIDDTFDRSELLWFARVFLGLDATRITTEMLPVGPSSDNPLVTLSPAAGSDVILQRLGGTFAPTSLASTAPPQTDDFRPC
jgi:LCP family protein required for cell wall assembly